MKTKKIFFMFLVVVLLSLLVSSTAFAKDKPDDGNHENNGNSNSNGNNKDNDNADSTCDASSNKKTDCDKAILAGKRLPRIANAVEQSGNEKLAEKYTEWQIEWILGVLEACTPTSPAPPVPQ